MMCRIRSHRFRSNGGDACSRWKFVGSLHVPRQTDSLKQPNKAEPDIDLPRIDAVFCRCRESVVVVMPALAHRRNSRPRNVMSLNRSIIDKPTLWPVRMTDVANKPMHGNTS